MRHNSAYYYMAVIPVWMIVNVLLQRATRASRQVLVSVWNRSLIALQTVQQQRRNDRALRAWMLARTA